VEAIQPDGICQRRLESGTQTLRFSFPAVLSLCEYSYTLRLPGILAMRRAKDKQVRLLTGRDIGLSPAEAGLKGSLTRVVRTETTFPGLRKGPKEEDPDAFCKKLISICEDEDFGAKVENMLNCILAECTSEFEKLPCIEDAEILRNILYAGVWDKFDKRRKEQESE
jgi:hypothetical protein